MSLDRKGGTTIGADQVGPVSQIGVIECIVAGGDRIFVAGANCQPVTRVLLDLEGNLTRLVALLLQGRLQETEVIVIPLGGLDDSFRNHCDSCMLQLGAKLEFRLTIEDRGMIGGLLQFFEEGIKLSPNLSLLALESLLHLGLDGVNCMLDLAATHLRLLILGLQGHSRKQLLHKADKDIVIGLLLLQVLQGRQQLIVLASLQFNLVKDLDEDSTDTGANAFERLLHILLKLAKRGHHLIPCLPNGSLQFLHIEGEGGESLQVLGGIADDQLQRTDLMRTVLLVVADAADHRLLYALRLEADQV
jgi:hypothetical protein